MTTLDGNGTMADELTLPVDDEILDHLGQPHGRRQVAAATRMQELGREFGHTYPYIWAPIEEQQEHLSGPINPHAIALAKPLVPHARVWGLTLGIVGALTLLLLLTSFLTRGLAIAGYLALGWLTGIGVLAIGYLVARGTAAGAEKKRSMLAFWLANIGMLSAGREIIERRSEAAAYQPSDAEFVPAGSPPAPSVYGVSPEGAVQLACEWMRYFGEGDAEPVQGSTSPLIGSRHYLAGVINGAETVDDAAIHELVGRAVADGRRPAYFATNGYSETAIAVATRSAIPLFVFDPVRGTITAATEAGFDRLRSGL